MQREVSQPLLVQVLQPLRNLAQQGDDYIQQSVDHLGIALDVGQNGAERHLQPWHEVAILLAIADHPEEWQQVWVVDCLQVGGVLNVIVKLRKGSDLDLEAPQQQASGEGLAEVLASPVWSEEVCVDLPEVFHERCCAELARVARAQYVDYFDA